MVTTTGNRLRILVIDDDSDTCINLRDILELDDWEVEVAGTLREALTRTNWDSYTAIILDRRLPDSFAEQALPLLRELAPQASIVVVTGSADVEGAVSALRLGANDYILKPINASELRTRLGRIVECGRNAQELEKQENILQSVLNTISEAVLVVDGEGRIQLCNPAMESLVGPVRVGVGPEGWPHRNLTFLPDTITPYPPEQLPLSRALRGEVVTDAEEFFRLPEANRHIWVSANASPLRDPQGQLQGAVVVFRDITERKRVEEALRRERNFVSGLIDTAQVIVLVLDPTGRIVRYNAFFEELSGRKLSEMIGKDWVTSFLPPETHLAARERLRALVAGTPLGGIVTPIVTVDGTEREIAWWYRMLREGGGGNPGLLAIGHDVTELKRVQEKLVQSERLAAIGQMMTGLAHESGNALQRSQACLQMLARRVSDRADVRDLVDRIQAAQDHLLHLYDDVRGYAAPIRLQLEVCHLPQLWQQAWEDLGVLRQGRSACLKERLNGVDLRCRGDAFRLKQVFRNILDNALAACPDPVEIEIRSRACCKDNREMLQISLIDNGPGLSAQQRHQLFDPFYTTKTRGTGLGLAIVRRIVEAHDGQVEVGESGPPGCEILITLPREVQ